MIKIKLLILGEETKSTGKTLKEALAGFKLEWNEIKGKGVMTIENEGNSYEHLFNMKILRRIFSNKIVMDFWAKNLEMFLKSTRETNIPESL